MKSLFKLLRSIAVAIALIFGVRPLFNWKADMYDIIFPAFVFIAILSHILYKKREET